MYINVVSKNTNIIFWRFLGEGKGQWPGEWGGPGSGELQYMSKLDLAVLITSSVADGSASQ